MKIILASASPRRRELLQQVGIEFTVIPSDCEEDCRETTPDKLVESLAEQKARNVAEKICQNNLLSHSRDFSTDSLIVILGSDTVVAKDGIILGKPTDEKNAFDMISGLQGRKHQVYSGVALLLCDKNTGEIKKQRFFHVMTEVSVFPMTSEEIRQYIATGEPMDKAGAYGIQGYFARYIEGITGDYYNVVGLPVSRVVREIEELL